MKNRSRVISILLALILAFTSMMPVFAMSEPAASATVSKTVAAKTVKKTTYKTAKKIKIKDYNLSFKSAVITNKRLGKDVFPDTLLAKGAKRSIKLSWSDVANNAGIDGFILLRKNKNGTTWTQLAKLKKTARSYTDKSAKTKNRLYSYVLVSYKTVDGKMMISDPSQWVSSLTTRSKKKNVNKISIHRPAKSSALMTGEKGMIALNYPKKAYSKLMRWSSSNSSIVSVDSLGRITGKAPGKATITIKTHTGFTIKTDVTVVKAGTAEGMLQVMRSWLDYSVANGKHKGIVDIYNAETPLPVGYRVKYYDSWCDATVTAAAIKSGNVSRIGRECGVTRHVKIFKNMGIWEEDEDITPQPGDIIVFNWFPKLKNNASHIGIVESVSNGMITTIEGNMGISKVGRRTIPVGWKYIRGYAKPAYADRNTSGK